MQTLSQVSPISVSSDGLIHLSAISATYDQTLLPIESLKEDAAHWLQYVDQKLGLAKTFLSSGTTLRDRSRSPFSASGLEKYKTASMGTFLEVLTHFFEKPLEVSGWSFVPPTSEWPDSSLAQMVAWIAERWHVHYSENTPLCSEQPVWVFATAFHIVQWADAGNTIQLPKGSIVIETGGTKGKSRSVNREELYALIEKTFGIEQRFIVSEYGMCELASQAYDFVPLHCSKEKAQLDQRRFQFPPWVKVTAIDKLGQTQLSGIGTLCVEDPMRSDLPWPLRTEDMVDLEADGRFKLLGRVPQTTLKGCSLLAEHLPDRAITPNTRPSLNFWAPDPDQIRMRAEQIHLLFQRLWDDNYFLALLTEELGSEYLAQWCLEDLKKSRPDSPSDWERTARKASEPKTMEQWLLLLPRTHSIAGFYPIAIASILGLDLRIRCPIDSSLLRYYTKIIAPDLRVEFLDANFRIGVSELRPSEALFVFGSDETIEELRSSTSHPIKGFGSCIAASATESNEIGALSPKIWRDLLSLGQLGCMSTRTVFVLNSQPETLKVYASLLLDVFPEELLAYKNYGDQLSLQHTLYQWRKKGLSFYDSHNRALPLIQTSVWQQDCQLDAYVTDKVWTFSLVSVLPDQMDSWSQWCLRQRELKILSGPQSLRNKVNALQNLWIPLGESNAPSWHGLHLGESLFGIRSLAEI